MTTAKTALPFKVLERNHGQNEEMVLPERFELSTSPLPRGCSTPEPRQRRGGFSGIGVKNASPLGAEIRSALSKSRCGYRPRSPNGAQLSPLMLDLTYPGG